jgi:hypothetical protein
LEIVSRATPLFAARSSWLITARRRRSRNHGRSIAVTSKHYKKLAKTPQ